MFIVTLAAFSVFFACCALQFLMLHRVARALAERHPKVWIDIGRKSFFLPNAVHNFIAGRKDRGLADADLTRKVLQAQLLFAVAIGAWLVFAASMFMGPIG